MFGLGPLLNHNVAAMGSGAGPVGTIWDSVKSPDWTLSGSNLIATHTANAGGFWSQLWGSASRVPATATSSYTVTLTTMTGGPLEAIIGLNDSTIPSAGAAGQGGDTDGISYQPANGNIDFNGSTVATVAAAVAGDVIKWTIVPNTSFDVYKNGSLLHSTLFTTLSTMIGGGTPNCVANPVFPIVSDGGTITGTVITGDFSSW